MINLIEYQQKAYTFVNDLGNNHNLVHAVFGIKDEVGEIVGAIKKHLFYGKELDLVNIKEELGDALWFIALGLSVLDCPLAYSDLGEDSEGLLYDLDGLVIASSIIWDLAFENGNVVKEMLYISDPKILIEPFGNALISVHALCLHFGFSIHDVAATNIAKLSTRYKAGKFNKQEAINRNLEAEREVLENYEVPNQ